MADPSQQIAPSYVWIVEHGEYEQWDVWGVYSSPEAGAERIIAQYGGPAFIVSWEPLEQVSDTEARLVGHFEVAWTSTTHEAVFDFQRWKVDEPGSPVKASTTCP